MSETTNVSDMSDVSDVSDHLNYGQPLGTLMSVIGMTVMFPF